jgi:hypothetical protein
MPQERTSSRSTGPVMRPKTLPRNLFHERRVVDDQPVPQPCELALERSAFGDGHNSTVEPSACLGGLVY